MQSTQINEEIMQNMEALIYGHIIFLLDVRLENRILTEVCMGLF